MGLQENQRFSPAFMQRSKQLIFFGIYPRILGLGTPHLAWTHSLYNIRPDIVRKALFYFNNLGAPNRETNSVNT
ncbi:hypothetical protein NQ317_010636 [Molorchus minor]|uniref:Uncharacterized protein n=1 Tax=Molorchus minor TaxID=1323400 RepID=A0ABQ9JBX2_9CUCU|nr:hypothetical protein NQ317_010636 [Molorchus minor]